MKNIIIFHHSLVSYDRNPDQHEAIDKYHISKGWGRIGYHYTISKGGEIKMGRPEEEVGAHCKEESMNYKSIGICLSGHFDNERPTLQQMESLEVLVRQINARNGKCTVYGHRKFASYKTCPGTQFTDEMIESFNNLSDITMTPEQEQLCLAWEYVTKCAHDFGTEEMKDLATQFAPKIRKLTNK